MKKLLYVTLLVILITLTGCKNYSVIGNGDKYIISEIKDEKDIEKTEPTGRYRIEFTNAGGLVYYTDSLYQVGDTLKFTDISK